MTTTVSGKRVIINYDDPTDLNKWTSVDQVKRKHITDESDPDGAEDYGYVDRGKSCNRETIEAATWLQNALRNWLIAH
jgi:hypothetical protein